MQIITNVSSPYAATPLRSTSATSGTATQPDPAAADATAATSGAGSYDFTSMTPKQLQSTINNLVTSGQMSLKDSSPLMTIASFAGGQSSSGSEQPIDVFSALNAGINYKQQNQAGDPQSGIENWQNALATLQGLQGEVASVDTYA